METLTSYNGDSRGFCNVDARGSCNGDSRGSCNADSRASSNVDAQESMCGDGHTNNGVVEAGSLTIIDQRTGLKYELQICNRGSLKSADFSKIKAGGDGKGLKLYDPGFIHTAPLESTICYVDGEKGILRYRGYPIEDLVEYSTYLEVTYLLQYGNLPTNTQLSEWEASIKKNSTLPKELLDMVAALPHDAHPMGNLVTALYGLSSFYPDANPLLGGKNIQTSRAVQDLQIARIIGKVASLVGAIYVHTVKQKPLEKPSNNLTFAENILYMFHSMGNRDYRPNPVLARALDILLIILAEHELGSSTAAALHLSSSGVDVYTAVAGATAALSGPLNGGAIEAVLEMLSRIQSVQKVPEFLEEVKKRKTKVPGFGHRVYKTYDPRVKLVEKLVQEVFSLVGEDPLLEVAIALEKAILSDDYFSKRKLYPNVSFRLGLIYRALGFPTQFLPLLLAIPRMAGHLAHWRESINDPATRIMRPQQWYVGEWLRHYPSVRVE